MASSRTRSSRSAAARGRAGNRGSGSSSSGSDSSQMMVMVGAAAIAIVIVLVIMMRGGEDETGDGTGKPTPPVSDSPRVAPTTPASAGAVKAGKAPARPAPELSHETLAKLDEILAQAKTHYNEGVTKRNAGDNRGAREAQAKAKTLLDQWEELIRGPLAWQEEAEMEDWAQPAEYDLLTRKYPGFSRLQKSVRMGGGK